MTASTPTRDHPRTGPMESWRGRKAVLASRGEVDGPRVAECDAALAWWRIRSRLISEMGITEERAESLLDLIVPQADAVEAGAPVAETSEPAEPAETDTETDAAAVSQ